MGTDHADPRILDALDRAGTRPLPPAEQLPGMDVRDLGGERLGTIGGAWTDPTGTLLRGLSVVSGRLDPTHRLVMAEDLRLGNDGAGDYLVLPGGRDRLGRAPVLDAAELATREADGAELRRWEP